MLFRSGYNKKLDEAKARGEHIANPFSLTPEAPEPLERLPYIVIVADEMGADPARISVEVPHPSDPFRRELPGSRAMGSGGSWGVRYWYEPLRKAGTLPATHEVVYGHAWKPMPRVTSSGKRIIDIKAAEGH